MRQHSREAVKSYSNWLGVGKYEQNFATIETCFIFAKSQ